MSDNKNGQLWSKVTYKDGKKEGPREGYYENGQLKEKGTYKDDKQEGPWVFFNEDGTKDMTGDCCSWRQGTGIYKNDKKVSV